MAERFHKGTSVSSRLGSIRISFRGGNGRIHAIPLAEAAGIDWNQVRPIRTPSFHRDQKRNPGWFWSAKANQLVPFESRLEFAYLLLADLDADVEWLLTQPLRFHWSADGRQRSHVPDALIRRRDGVLQLLNVTVETRLENPEVAERLRAARVAARRLGWRFRLAVGAPPRVRLQNARLLASCRRPPHQTDGWAPIVLDRAKGGASIEELERAAGPSALIRPVVLHLVATGALHCDLGEPLQRSTRVITVEG